MAKKKNSSENKKEKNLKNENLEQEAKNEAQDSQENENHQKTDKEQNTAPEEREEETKPAEPTPEDQARSWQDKYLRLSADFDNYRKRSLKERMELTKNAGEDILKDFLPVMDDFERAMKSLEDSQSVDAIKEGLSLIYKQLNDFLKQKNIKPIEAMHQEFDTDLHDAVTKIPAPEKKLKGKVVDVIKKGYMMNDKVIRYSQVVVGE